MNNSQQGLREEFEAKSSLATISSADSSVKGEGSSLGPNGLLATATAVVVSVTAASNKTYQQLPQSEPESPLVVCSGDRSSSGVCPSSTTTVMSQSTSCAPELASESNSSEASTTDADDSDDKEEEEEEDEEEVEDEEADDSEYDDYLSCNVCDRAFTTARQLVQHQMNKKHFGCSVCDGLFPSLLSLKDHKESLEHWSDGEGPTNEDKANSDGSDDECIHVHPPCEELERLL